MADTDPIREAIAKCGFLGLFHGVGQKTRIGFPGITRAMVLAALDDEETFWFERFDVADGGECTWITMKHPVRAAVPAWAVTRLPRPTKETVFAVTKEPAP